MYVLSCVVYISHKSDMDRFTSVVTYSHSYMKILTISGCLDLLI